MRFTES